MKDDRPYLCLVYSSRLIRPLSELEMKQLVEQADKENRDREITGILLRVGSRIVQYLEGPTENVARLYNRINQDRRHIDVKVVHLDTVLERIFKSWNCLYRSVEEQKPEAPLEIERVLKNHFRNEPELETAMSALIRMLPRTHV